jgi:hypothetical protein
MNGIKLEIREGHIPEQSFIFTTPTIKYAALDCYAETNLFTSPKDGNCFTIKVVLQCKQKPGSFVVQPETVGARRKNRTICSEISNDEIEWKTQQRASIMPYRSLLLIRQKAFGKAFEIVSENYLASTKRVTQTIPSI